MFLSPLTFNYRRDTLRARVARVSDELRRNGVDVQPVHIEGRTIARSFWGRRWCHHLEWVRLFFVDGFFAYL